MAVEVRPTTKAGELAEFARNLRYEQLPKEVVAKAKMHILDALGIAIASSKFDFAQAVIQTVRGWGGEQQATVIGTGDRVPAVNAALANG
ncbi:MAG: MmgE/PrpD family protein, partial [Chloroflexi bacterium]|nr:MmgE/PrpD family protein [Chloroflexota bacterium]